MRRKKLDYQHYGLTQYEVDGQTWALGDDTNQDAKGRTRVDRAARRAVVNSLWAFKTGYIVNFLASRNPAIGKLSGRARLCFERGLAKLQEELCEDAGPIVRALLGKHLSRFVDNAIRDDGRGHFLSGYNGEEQDSDNVPGLPKGRIAFRTN